MLTQRDHVCRHGVLTHAVIAKGQHIGLLGDEVRHAVFVDEAHGDHVVAFAQQSFGDIVAARRVLVVGMSDLLTVQIGDLDKPTMSKLKTACSATLE